MRRWIIDATSNDNHNVEEEVGFCYKIDDEPMFFWDIQETSDQEDEEQPECSDCGEDQGELYPEYDEAEEEVEERGEDDEEKFHTEEEEDNTVGLISEYDGAEIPIETSGNLNRREPKNSVNTEEETNVKQGERVRTECESRGATDIGATVNRTDQDSRSGDHALGQGLEGNTMQNLGVHHVATTTEINLTPSPHSADDRTTIRIEDRGDNEENCRGHRGTQNIPGEITVELQTPEILEETVGRVGGMEPKREEIHDGGEFTDTRDNLETHTERRSVPQSGGKGIPKTMDQSDGSGDLKNNLTSSDDDADAKGLAGEIKLRVAVGGGGDVEPATQRDICRDGIEGNLGQNKRSIEENTGGNGPLDHGTERDNGVAKNSQERRITDGSGLAGQAQEGSDLCLGIERLGRIRLDTRRDKMGENPMEHLEEMNKPPHYPDERRIRGTIHADRRDRGSDLRVRGGPTLRTGTAEEEETEDSDTGREPAQRFEGGCMSGCGRRKISYLPQQGINFEDQESERRDVATSNQRMDTSSEGRKITAKCGSDLLHEVPGSLPGPLGGGYSGRDRRMDSSYQQLEKLKEEIKILKNCPASKSAIVTWNTRSMQVHFEESHAIDSITKKIKDTWAIPRKYYWLRINGVHESKIREWPQVSNVSIEIRGLGAGPSKTLRAREVKICIEGKVSVVDRYYSFWSIFDEQGAEAPEEIWATNRQRISVDETIKGYIYTGAEEIFAYDGPTPSDLEVLKRGAIGRVKLNLEGQTFETWNNMYLEKAIQEQEIPQKAHFLEVPSLGISVDSRAVRIRSIAPAVLRSPMKLRCDLTTQEKVERGEIPEHTEGIYITNGSASSDGNFPQMLGTRLRENFRTTGKLDWRIIHGEDEIEEPVVKKKAFYEDVIILIGERFIWDDENRPKPLSPWQIETIYQNPEKTLPSEEAPIQIEHQDPEDPPPGEEILIQTETEHQGPDISLPSEEVLTQTEHQGSEDPPPVEETLKQTETQRQSSDNPLPLEEVLIQAEMEDSEDPPLGEETLAHTETEHQDLEKAPAEEILIQTEMDRQSSEEPPPVEEISTQTKTESQGSEELPIVDLCRIETEHQEPEGLPLREEASRKTQSQEQEEEEVELIDYKKLSEDYDPEGTNEASRKPEKTTEKNAIPGKTETKEEPEEDTEKGPSEKFWEDCERMDNTLRKPVELPASPKNKKKNHARRERRLATQRRLEEEGRKELEKAALIRRKRELRERRSMTPRTVRIAFPEDPIRAQLEDGSGHWRPVRKSDLGKYVIRSAQGKIRRVCVQPTWLGRCSPRRFLKEQNKHDVLQFLSCAIKVQIPERGDFIQEFTERPYFARPGLLNAGRASPETASKWRVEDEIENSKDTRKWTSVASGTERRRRERKERCQQEGKNPSPNEDISDLMVDCDFQEVDVALPERSRRLSPERGYYFETANSKEPIEDRKRWRNISRKAV
jgi:hypothetical protein